MENTNQLVQINQILEEHEKIISHKYGGDIVSRLSHVLGQYRQTSDNAIFQAKNFLEDVKVQFKALEIITEGITGQDLNHGQKRVIANHIITSLRRMVDKLDNADFSFTTGMFDRYNFFRSTTPEGRLHEDHRQLKYKSERQEELLKKLKEEHPEVFKDHDDLPF